MTTMVRSHVTIELRFFFFSSCGTRQEGNCQPATETQKGNEIFPFFCVLSIFFRCLQVNVFVNLDAIPHQWLGRSRKDILHDNGNDMLLFGWVEREHEMLGQREEISK